MSTLATRVRAAVVRSPERAALAVILAGAFALLMWNSRGQFFVLDEWAFYARAGDLDFERVIESHVGNLHAVPNLLYAALFEVFGADSYLPFRLVWAGLAVTVALLVYRYAEPRVGGWVAAGMAALISVLGAGWEVLGGPLGITLLLCSASGLGMLMLLGRRTLRADTGAAVLLAVSLATYSAGIAWAAGAAIELAQRGRGGRRRAWVVAVPALAYAAWRIYELRFDETMVTLSNVLSLPASLFASLAAVISALTGTFRGTGEDFGLTIGTDPGRALALFAIAAVAARFAVRGRWPLDRRVWALIAMPIVLWMAIGADAGAPDVQATGRYQYIGGVFMLLLVAELLSGWRPSRRAGAALAAVLALALAGNLAQLRDAGRYLRENGEQNRAQLAAVELVREHVDSEIVIELITDDVGLFEDILIPAGFYFTSVDAIGSPTYGADRIPAQRESVRERADSQLISILRLTPRAASEIPNADPASRAPGPDGGRVAIEAAANGVAIADGACVRFVPRLAGAVVAVTLPPGGFVVDQLDDAPGATFSSARSPIRRIPAVSLLRLRRFGDRFVTALPPAGVPAPVGLADQVVEIPADARPEPWHLELVADAPVAICPT